MHGRVKVRTSAEQAEAKRREREEKVRVYREITDKIYTKRSAGELDDEALKLTAGLLSENPDISTFWNYRREILEARLPSLPKEDAVQLCGREFSLLERCLQVNPKSYGIWLHRQWVATHTPSPNWEREKGLCDLFLKFDERNFHCWDYRRFVISKAGISPKEEFDFTYKKIEANFSNYSAWHYRSKLLPKLHPHPEKEGGVAEEALLNEYELVQNAFFTDPSDQSAWFYHRWLLGKVDKPLAFSCVLFRRTPNPMLYVVFNQPVRVTASRPVAVTVGESPVSSLVQSDWPEPLWACPIPDEVMSANSDKDMTLKVKFEILEATLTVKQGEKEGWWLGRVEEVFSSTLTAATSSVLRSELDSCQELLQLEPENKWCLLTTLLLMQALDSQQYRERITETFKKLLTVDPYREGYYRDLLSKFQIEQTLLQLLKNSQGLNWTLDLSNKELSRLYYTEHMLLFQTVHLSNNQLRLLHGVENLQRVETLVLDGNQLESLPRELGKLPELRVLSLKNNNLAELCGLESLRGLPLEGLNIEGNPLCVTADLVRDLSQMLPALRELNGKPVEREH